MWKTSTARLCGSLGRGHFLHPNSDLWFLKIMLSCVWPLQSWWHLSIFLPWLGHKTHSTILTPRCWDGVQPTWGHYLTTPPWKGSSRGRRCFSSLWASHAGFQCGVSALCILGPDSCRLSLVSCVFFLPFFIPCVKSIHSFKNTCSPSTFLFHFFVPLRQW